LVGCRCAFRRWCRLRIAQSGIGFFNSLKRDHVLGEVLSRILPKVASQPRDTMTLKRDLEKGVLLPVRIIG
jgi:hypothetical protein